MVAVDVKKMDLPTLITLRATVDAEIADKQQAARASFVDAIAGKLTADEMAAMKSHGGAIRERIAQRRAEYLAQIMVA